LSSKFLIQEERISTLTVFELAVRNKSHRNTILRHYRTRAHHVIMVIAYRLVSHLRVSVNYVFVLLICGVKCILKVEEWFQNPQADNGNSPNFLM
jgi:hypothetical protein